jgi:hypothetical protein
MKQQNGFHLVLGGLPVTWLSMPSFNGPVPYTSPVYQNINLLFGSFYIDSILQIAMTFLVFKFAIILSLIIILFFRKKKLTGVSRRVIGSFYGILSIVAAVVLFMDVGGFDFFNGFNNFAAIQLLIVIVVAAGLCSLHLSRSKPLFKQKYFLMLNIILLAPSVHVLRWVSYVYPFMLLIVVVGIFLLIGYKAFQQARDNSR